MGDCQSTVLWRGRGTEKHWAEACKKKQIKKRIRWVWQPECTCSNHVSVDVELVSMVCKQRCPCKRSADGVCDICLRRNECMNREKKALSLLHAHNELKQHQRSLGILKLSDSESVWNTLTFVMYIPGLKLCLGPEIPHLRTLISCPAWHWFALWFRLDKSTLCCKKVKKKLQIILSL